MTTRLEELHEQAKRGWDRHFLGVNAFCMRCGGEFFFVDHNNMFVPVVKCPRCLALYVCDPVLGVVGYDMSQQPRVIIDQG